MHRPGTALVRRLLSRHTRLADPAQSRCLSIGRVTADIPVQIRWILPQITTAYSPRVPVSGNFYSTDDGGNKYPEHIRVKLPALSPTMTAGTLISWEKKKGERVVEGDLLCEIETDKATMGFETPDEGYIAKIFLDAGTKDIPLGTLMCIIVSEEADVDKFDDYTPDSVKDDDSTSETSAKPNEPETSTTTPTSQTATADDIMTQSVVRKSVSGSGPGMDIHQPVTNVVGDRPMLSPAAKKLAADKGVDVSGIGRGSGMDGMVTTKDVVAFMNSGQASSVQSFAGATPLSSRMPHESHRFAIGDAASFTDAELTSMRKTIAKRLQASKLELPHYYLTSQCSVDALLALRSKLNKQYAVDGIKLSVNDFVIKAVAMASLRVPECNSAWMDTFIRQYHTVDVSVAVDTGSGLITPIVTGVESRGLASISAQIKELAGRAREGKLQPAEFMGGTITVSNLGMFGIDQFTAIINPPQACILAVGGISDLPRMLDKDGQTTVVNSKSMKVTLSCDHRVVDGAVGAQWLQHFKSLIEDPVSMML